MKQGNNDFSDRMANQKCQESITSANRVGTWSVKERYTKWHKGGHIWSQNGWKTNVEADCYADSFVKGFDELTVCLTEMLKLRNVSIFFRYATALFVPI